MKCHSRAIRFGIQSLSIWYSQSLWWWYFAVTGIYSVLYFIYPRAIDHPDLNSGWHYITPVIGLFTPVGPLSFIVGVVFPLLGLSILVTLVSVGLAEAWSRKRNLMRGGKLLFNLAALLAITILADLARWMPFESWLILFGREPFHD